MNVDRDPVKRVKLLHPVVFGENQVKRLLSMVWLIGFFTLGAQTVYACSCREITGLTVLNDAAPKPDPEKIRRWRLDQTDSALFIGTIVKIQKVKVGPGGLTDRSPTKKATVKVDKYWLGVKTPEIVVHTGVGGGDCGVPYVKGRQYFFWASRDRVSGTLRTDICSPTKVNDELISDLNEVLGNAKEFL
jgi:hypothetical protein